MAGGIIVGVLSTGDVPSGVDDSTIVVVGAKVIIGDPAGTTSGIVFGSGTDPFTGSTYTGLAGEQLCDTAHTLLNDSGTWSNRIAGNPSLSVTGYQAGLELMEAQVDHQGDPMPMVARRLLVDRTDEFTAIQLTKNANEPNTTDRNINAALNKQGINDYKLLHYKTADGSWFIQDPSMHDMKFKFRIRPQFGDDQDSGGTLAAKFWGRQRILVYFFDQRGIIGSDGLGS